MDAKSSNRPNTRQGFTLVELLVVIVIISMLAGLVITGGSMAIITVKNMTISSEIQQMTMALENYKTACGDYPPDCFCSVGLDYSGGNAAMEKIRDQARNSIIRHLRKRFPRYRPGTWDELRLAVYNASSGLSETNKSNIDPEKGFDIEKLDPSLALMFFIGGIPDYEPDTSVPRLPTDPDASGGELMGFSVNPNNPFARGGSRTTSPYEFDVPRVAWDETDQIYKYYPKHIKNPGNSNQGVPYAYFRARTGGYGASLAEMPYISCGEAGVCAPYARKNTFTDWYKPKSYQIIAAGLYGEFGNELDTSGTLPTVKELRYFNADDSNLKSEDDDNLTSFTPGKLEDGVQ